MKTAESLNFKRIGTTTLNWETFSAVRLKLVKGRGWETDITREVKKD